jgi:hypothetical protein
MGNTKDCQMSDPKIVSKHSAGWCKELNRRDIERAMANTKSNKGAARYLSVTLPTYKKYAKLYKNENGESLYDLHNNKPGVGIPRMNNSKDKRSALLKAMSSEVDRSFFSHKMLKEGIIYEGLLKERCCRCDFHDKRELDFKAPLILNFRDGNKRNWNIDNLEFLCYNCYFITVADIFDKKQLDLLEDFTRPSRDLSTLFELPKTNAEAIIESKNLDNQNILFDVPPIEELPDDFGDDLIVRYSK